MGWMIATAVVLLVWWTAREAREMGKRGNERPHVVGTRLNDREKALLDAQRGAVPVAVWLRHLITQAEKR